MDLHKKRVVGNDYPYLLCNSWWHSSQSAIKLVGLNPKSFISKSDVAVEIGVTWWTSFAGLIMERSKQRSQSGWALI